MRFSDKLVSDKPDVTVSIYCMAYTVVHNTTETVKVLHTVLTVRKQSLMPNCK